MVFPAHIDKDCRSLLGWLVMIRTLPSLYVKSQEIVKIYRECLSQQKGVVRKSWHPAATFVLGFFWRVFEHFQSLPQRRNSLTLSPSSHLDQAYCLCCLRVCKAGNSI